MTGLFCKKQLFCLINLAFFNDIDIHNFKNESQRYLFLDSYRLYPELRQDDVVGLPLRHRVYSQNNCHSSS